MLMVVLILETIFFLGWACRDFVGQCPVLSPAAILVQLTDSVLVASVSRFQCVATTLSVEQWQAGDVGRI